MRQKKVSHKRTEVRVEAIQVESGWEVKVYDQAGMLAKTSCISRSNVASKATRAAATALNTNEGRIKINRVEYA